MLSDVLYCDHPSEAPTKPACHPFLLIKTDAVNGEVRDCDCIRTELFVHTDKTLDGLFVNARDATFLGLEAVGTAETPFGLVVRLSSLHISFLSHSHSMPIANIYQLPPAFEGTIYGDGIVGISVLFSLGVSVAFDRGFVYLVRNGMEDRVVGGTQPEDGPNNRFADNMTGKRYVEETSWSDDGGSDEVDHDSDC
ncbi:hypothetical protein BC830DRAFT_1088731 [Chytriomyces sp. MP71]|nr:hypothetical protein BC830DRAFT_1088731 [Chytriomyces sp. MP71]